MQQFELGAVTLNECNGDFSTTTYQLRSLPESVAVSQPWCREGEEPPRGVNLGGLGVCNRAIGPSTLQRDTVTFKPANHFSIALRCTRLHEGSKRSVTFCVQLFVDRICGYSPSRRKRTWRLCHREGLEVCDAAKKMGGIGFGYPARILTRRRLNYGQLPGGWLKPENRFRVPMKV